MSDTLFGALIGAAGSMLAGLMNRQPVAKPERNQTPINISLANVNIVESSSSPSQISLRNFEDAKIELDKREAEVSNRDIRLLHSLMEIDSNNLLFRFPEDEAGEL